MGGNIIKKIKHKTKKHHPITVVLKPIKDKVIKPIETTVIKPIETTVIKPIETAVIKPIEEKVIKPIETVVIKPIEEKVIEPIEDIPNLVKNESKNHKKNKTSTTPISPAQSNTILYAGVLLIGGIIFYF